jgi:alpha-beta hydrolase superfamily lysophospholipase
MQSLDLRIDVSKAAGLGEDATIVLTVHLPDADALAVPPIVCFGKPGGGYSRRYYTVDLPGPGRGAQAEWHTKRGWVFVSVDHLGVGESTTHHDGARLDFTTVAAASQAAEQEVLQRLAAGTLVAGFPDVTHPVLLGIGQSMGGCMTIIQQGRYHCYDGIGVLGYGAIHTHPPVRPGAAPIVAPWLPRDTMLGDPMVIVNTPQLAAAQLRAGEAEAGPAMGWGFFYDDVDPEVVRADLEDFPGRNGKVPPWGSATLPEAVAATCLTPGCVLPEAAAVVCPVLVAMGERDVIADPKGEPRVYQSATSVDLFVCPHMGHMHNFAGTRQLFWRRIETWAAWVTQVKASMNGKAANAASAGVA